MLERLTPGASSVVREAEWAARWTRDQSITAVDLVLGMLATEGSDAGRLLLDVGADPRAVVQRARRVARTRIASPSHIPFGQPVLRAIERAVVLADEQELPFVPSRLLLLGLLKTSPDRQHSVLAQFGVSATALEGVARTAADAEPLGSHLHVPARAPAAHPASDPRD